ncbi:nitrogen fixation NifU-like protein [Microbacteriaceae bacterium SG_E_30_P1]|uniref:Nitrogen fixation NifU-like protein n=1 Tax=Antiquaquibacter oligotrophicus TaxID=2880260 RepID=A0ABT6KPI7_9MICO|nr:SUF system NifU family Fe-S cluster assembly protein [Antiquaquibacter oligotrophicus]MDH6181388.1 nitrogen fixation NifU-like protein [Antiquaquibacter oligotrophicus]UDF12920.1 SUF system NifU family Fe-S cluster assembly protein [Antiquaquibacter oligotrophicus]
MSDLGGLYQELILDHAKRPQGRALLENPSGQSHQLNPTCGDEVTVTIRVENGVVSGFGWEGHGCAISQSSASILSALIVGRSIEDTRGFIEEFRSVLRSRGELELDEERFGDAIAFNGVSRYTARVKCAMLPWVALEAALIAS